VWLDRLTHERNFAMKETPHAVCLTFDFDGMSLWIGSFQSNNPSQISRGEFALVGLPRLLDLLRQHEVPATFFVPGHTAHAWPDLVARIAEDGHEIGHHGWVHENPAKLERDQEVEVFERGFEALEHVIGERPTGYRSAAWDFSPNSIDLLLDYGFLYDSSCMASDFYPYYLRQGDRWSTTEPYVFGELVELVELAPSWGLDDFPPLEYVWGANGGPMIPSQVLELWQGEFDYMVANCPGGVYNLTCHPQFIGRGARISMLEQLIEHMQQSDVKFERLRDVATRFKEGNPLSAWAEANPHRAGLAARQPAPSA
jgi:peptidoglycan/xylan/chitin deacetylase (PgdA/CDA1 family)